MRGVLDFLRGFPQWVRFSLAIVALSVVASAVTGTWTLLWEIPVLIAVLAAATGIVLLFVAILALPLASVRAYFTRVEQGTTVFISVGDALRHIWPNVGGFHVSSQEDLDGRRWLIRAKNEKERMDSFFHNALPGTMWYQKWLWKMFAVRFISFFWPHVRVQLIELTSRLRIIEGGVIEAGKPLRERVTPSKEDLTVSSLLFLVPRPIYLEGLSLGGDNSRVNFLLLSVFQQVVPSLPAYYYKGDFFPPLDTAIEAAVVNFLATHRVAVYKDSDEARRGKFAADYYDYEPPPYKPPKPPRPLDEGEINEEEKAKYEEEKKKYDARYRRRVGRERKKHDERVAEWEPAHLTYAHWIKLTKTGEDSPLERHVRKLNVTEEYFKLLRDAGKEELLEFIETIPGERPQTIEAVEGEEVAKYAPHGIVPRFGFALTSFRIVDWEVHSSSEDLANALRERETQFHTAEGVRREAEGQRDAILARAHGESQRYNQLVTALIEKGVSKDEAARVVNTQVRTENIRDSDIVTYVEGGAGASVLVPPTSPSDSPQTPPPQSPQAGSQPTRSRRRSRNER